MKKYYPMLAYYSKILGIFSILSAGILVAYSMFFKKINEDIAIWLTCFGLFCFAYRNEKDEKDEKDKYLLYRYHAFRISFALTTIIILTASSTFIFEGTTIKINCLYTLLIFCFIYNVLYFIIKNKKILPEYKSI